jgi:nucleoside-diphosphate-sugar epimerase
MEEKLKMKILITGAFGNLGKAVLEMVNKRKHEAIVFELENKKTRKTARKLRKKITEVLYGDIRNYSDVQEAVERADAVIHLAAIIPPFSKTNRELTMAVNYDGTVNLVKAIEATNREIPFIFTSSASVMGPTQEKEKLVEPDDPLVITGNYEESKIKCERFLKEQADNYLIFRLAGVLPILSPFSLDYMEELFDMHPDMRLEMVLDVDVATALVTGAEKLKAKTTPKNEVYILGGGKKNGWQLKGEEFLTRLFKAFSLPLPERKYFTPDINTFHLDWYDTTKAEQEFHFQTHSFEEFVNYLKKKYRFAKLPIRLFPRLIMRYLVKKSPYYTIKKK